MNNVIELLWSIATESYTTASKSSFGSTYCSNLKISNRMDKSWRLFCCKRKRRYSSIIGSGWAYEIDVLLMSDVKSANSLSTVSNSVVACRFWSSSLFKGFGVTYFLHKNLFSKYSSFYIMCTWIEHRRNESWKCLCDHTLVLLLALTNYKKYFSISQPLKNIDLTDTWMRIL